MTRNDNAMILSRSTPWSTALEINIEGKKVDRKRKKILERTDTCFQTTSSRHRLDRSWVVLRGDRPGNLHSIPAKLLHLRHRRPSADATSLH